MFLSRLEMADVTKVHLSLLGNQTQMSASIQNENVLHNFSQMCHALFTKHFQLSGLHHSV